MAELLTMNATVRSSRSKGKHEERGGVKLYVGLPVEILLYVQWEVLLRLILIPQICCGQPKEYF